MDRRAWRATVHKVIKSQTQLKQLNTHTHSDFTCFIIFTSRCGREWHSLSTAQRKIKFKKGC